MPTTKIANNQMKIFPDLALKSGSVNQFSDLNATGPLIDDAVAKRHVQNTDLGTSSSTFYIGTGGPKLKNNGGTLEIVTNNTTAYADLVVNNLTVHGSQTVIHSEVVSIADNVIVLNSNYSGSSPTENGGVEVKRGSLPNASLIWNESMDLWRAGLVNNERTLVRESNSITLTGDVSASSYFNNLGNIELLVTVLDNSHNHTIANVTGLQAALDSKLPSVNYNAADILSKLKTVDGVDSGLDADLLDGYSSSVSAVANTVVVRDSNGNIVSDLNGNASTASRLLNTITISLSGDVSGSTLFNGSSNVTITAQVLDNSHNHTIANVTGLQAALDSVLNTSDLHDMLLTIDGAGSGIDADLLDGQHGSYYRNASNLNAGTIHADRGVLAGSSSYSFLRYTGLDNVAGGLNGGSTAPTGTNRLNYSGYFYATRVYNAVYNDFAECFNTSVKYQTSKNRIVEFINGKAQLANPNSDAVIGVVSDSYGYILNGDEADIIAGRKVPVGMAGTVMVDAEYTARESDMGCFVCAGFNGKARVIPKGEAYKYEGKIVGKIIDIDYNKNQYKIIICLR